MALCYVEIGKPASIAHASPLLAVPIHPKPCVSRFIVSRHFERHVATYVAKPYLIFNNEFENFFIADCVLVPDNYESFVVLNELGNVLTEQ